MKKLTKKKIIIISAVAVILAVAIPISVKNIRSYVAYMDSFGSDSIQEALERTIENHNYRERIMGVYPRKTLEHDYGKKWWENQNYLKNEKKSMNDMAKYGWRAEYRYLEIVSKGKVDKKYLKEDLDFGCIYDAGLEIEEAYSLEISYQIRIRYDFDVKLERYGGAAYSPVGKWSEWGGSYNQPYMAYKVDGKWYCKYWGE